MDIKQLITDDEAVSPVIGVILMVAITVILAAVIGTFVLGLGDQVQDTAPQASFNFDYQEDEDGTHDMLTVTHDGGDKLVSDTVSFTSNGATDEADSDGASLKTANSWSDRGGTYPVTAGSSVELDEGDYDLVDDTNDGALTQLDLSGATIRVVWSGESGDNTATLGKWEGPDA